jgi:hypothetical protein
MNPTVTTPTAVVVPLREEIENGIDDDQHWAN